jgi:hypothetical protein
MGHSAKSATVGIEGRPYHRICLPRGCLLLIVLLVLANQAVYLSDRHYGFAHFRWVETSRHGNLAHGWP